MKLKDKVAIITGGSKGIGFGCAQVFVEQGCRVAIASRGAEAGREAAEKLNALREPDSALFVATDVTDEKAIASLIDTTIQRWGRLDCVVNNAGWHPPATPIEEISLDDFNHLLQLNLASAFLSCKYALPHLVETKGNIINMSSAVAEVGQPLAAAYVSTKAGLIGLTRALAIDFAPKQVRINAVCPAGVMTPLMQDWAETQYDKEAALADVDSWHLLGRMATSEEIGKVCAFLASDEASFITGQAIFPEGGALLGYRR